MKVIKDYTKSEIHGLLIHKASITYVDNAIANQSTLTINTLTTSSSALNIKSDLVQFKGMNNTNYMKASPTGITSSTNLQVDGTINVRAVFLYNNR